MLLTSYNAQVSPCNKKLSSPKSQQCQGWTGLLKSIIIFFIMKIIITPNFWEPTVCETGHEGPSTRITHLMITAGLWVNSQCLHFKAKESGARRDWGLAWGLLELEVKFGIQVHRTPAPLFSLNRAMLSQTSLVERSGASLDPCWTCGMQVGSD